MKERLKDLVKELHGRGCNCRGHVEHYGHCRITIADRIQAILDAEPAAPTSELREKLAKVLARANAYDALEPILSIIAAHYAAPAPNGCVMRHADAEFAKWEARQDEGQPPDKKATFCAGAQWAEEYTMRRYDGFGFARPSQPVQQASAGDAQAAIIEALIVRHILNKENETDPRKALNDLFRWEVTVALDPAVSSKAANLAAKARLEGHKTACPNCLMGVVCEWAATLEAAAKGE